MSIVEVEYKTADDTAAPWSFYNYMAGPTVEIGTVVWTGPATYVPTRCEIVLRATVIAWRCVGCGCTDEQACPEGCEWVAPDLCSECV